MRDWVCKTAADRPPPLPRPLNADGAPNPFTGMPTENYIESLEAGQRWHIPPETRETERSILLSCWQMEPSQRPKMGVLTVACECWWGQGGQGRGGRGWKGVGGGGARLIHTTPTVPDEHLIEAEATDGPLTPL